MCSEQLPLGEQGVMMERMLVSPPWLMLRIMARCGRQSPHRASPHCFIALGTRADIS